MIGGGAEERLKGIATFVQVVEAGSFSAAADRLRQTRSAVGKTIARLELRLGTRLFNRSTRRQSLTQNGQVLLERCRRALAEIEAAEAILRESTRELTGRLRITAPLLIGRHLVAPILTQLTMRHPKLDLEMAFTDQVVDLIEEGFDLAFRTGPLRDSTTLAARALGSFDYVICASPQYLARKGIPDTAQQFEDHVGIVYSRVGLEQPWESAGPDGRLQDLPIRRRIRMDDVAAITEAALRGIGLARLPRWLAAPHVEAGALRYLWDGVHKHATTAHVVWPRTRYLPQRTRAAIDALATDIPKALAAGTD